MQSADMQLFVFNWGRVVRVCFASLSSASWDSIASCGDAIDILNSFLTTLNHL